MSPAPRTRDDEWVERGGTISFKWAARQPGEEWVGTWLGTEPGGKFGPRGLLDVGTEVLKLGLPTALLGRVQELPAGTRVKIVYAGMEKTDAGKPFHSFKVFTVKGAPRPPVAAPTDAPPPRADHEAPSSPDDEEDKY